MAMGKVEKFEISFVIYELGHPFRVEIWKADIGVLWKFYFAIFKGA